MFHFIPKWFALLLVTVLALIAGNLTPAMAAYTVDPLRVEMSVSDAGMASTSLRVQNTGTEPIRLRAYVQSWNLNEDGTLMIYEEPQPGAITDWLRFNPKEFEIPAGGYQVVRMAISTPVDAGAGEYRGMLFFEDLKTSTQRIKDESDGYGASVEIKQRLGIAVYVYKGGPQAAPELTAFQCEVKDGKLDGTVDIANTGNRHARVTGTMLIQKQDEAGVFKPFREVHLNDLREIIVLPGTTRKVEQLMIDSKELADAPPGHYKADVKLSWKGAPTSKTKASSSYEFSLPLAGSSTSAEPADATKEWP